MSGWFVRRREQVSKPINVNARVDVPQEPAVTSDEEVQDIVKELLRLGVIEGNQLKKQAKPIRRSDNVREVINDNGRGIEILNVSDEEADEAVGELFEPLPNIPRTIDISASRKDNRREKF